MVAVIIHQVIFPVTPPVDSLLSYVPHLEGEICPIHTYSVDMFSDNPVYVTIYLTILHTYTVDMFSDNTVHVTIYLSILRISYACI